MKHTNDDEYITRAMLREDEYVTRTMLREEFEKFEARFEAKINAQIDHKLEVMRRRIIDDVTEILSDFMERQAEIIYALFEGEKPPKYVRKINKRIDTVETKLSKASTALR